MCVCARLWGQLFDLKGWLLGLLGVPLFFVMPGHQAEASRSGSPKAPPLTRQAPVKPALSGKAAATKKAPKHNADQAVAQLMKAFASQRKQRKRPTKVLPQPEHKRWLLFLVKVERWIPRLSKPTLHKLRQRLLLDSEQDRNLYEHFPESLSTRVIQAVVKVSLRLRLFKAGPRASQGRGGPFPPTQRLARPQQTPPVVRDKSKLPTLVFTQKDLERFRTPTSRLAWPIKNGHIGSGFGWRRDPFTGKLSFHGAVDIGAKFGTPVFAAETGVVLRTGWMSSCGMGIVVRHSTSMKTYYCHLSQLLTSRGKIVKRGQHIGAVGSTGRSTSPHLHFVVILHGRPVNPAQYLP